MARSKPKTTTDLSQKTSRYPIATLNFAEKMTKRIQSLNPSFYCGGKIRDGFIQYAKAYNECVKLNASGDRLQIVVPAPTGSGKSVSARLYLAEISKIGLSGLLVVAEVSEAKEAAKTINLLAGKKVAGVYHSISGKHPRHGLWCDINELPRITIISHAMFIQRSDSGKDIEALRGFEGKQRDIVIIDERIDLIKRVSFGSNEITEAVGILRRDHELNGFARSLENFNEVVIKQKKTGSLRYNAQIKSMHHELRKKIDSLAVEIQYGHYNLTQQIRGRKRNPATDRAHVVDLLKRVSYIFESRYSNTVEGKNVVCHREENLSGKFGSVVVLDATANINPEYGYRSTNNHSLKYLSRINSRDYSHVIIHICSSTSAKQSKFAIYNKPKEGKCLDKTINGYLELIGLILEPGDRLLVVSYMDVVDLFNEKSPFGNQVKFIHWGSKDARGSNQFADFNKALVIGWHRKPMHTYVQSVIAINQVDKYVNSNGSVMSDANHLKDMLIVDDIIHFFNRIRCRTATDGHGNCKPTELYCLTGGNNSMEKLIRSTIQEEMPNIIINEWEPKIINGIKKKISKTEERSENIVRWLRGRIEKYEEISLIEIKDHFKLKGCILSRVINSDAFQAMLDDEGITMTRDKGKFKGNPVRFILPPQRA